MNSINKVLYLFIVYLQRNILKALRNFFQIYISGIHALNVTLPELMRTRMLD